MSKPRGVTIFGIIEIISGLFGIFVGTLSFFVSPILSSMQPQIVNLIFLAIVSLILGAFVIVAGIGVLLLKKWARKLIIILAIFSILLSSFNTIVAGVFSLSTVLFLFLGIIYNAILIKYFVSEKVKQVFELGGVVLETENNQGIQSPLNNKTQ